MLSAWAWAFAALFSIGALASLAMGLLPPKTSNPLGLGMTFITFALWFMAAFTTFYLNSTSNFTGYIREN
jgi:hypothetical protein